jgi:hypothetical protein
VSRLWCIASTLRRLLRCPCRLDLARQPHSIRSLPLIFFLTVKKKVRSHRSDRWSAACGMCWHTGSILDKYSVCLRRLADHRSYLVFTSGLSATVLLRCPMGNLVKRLHATLRGFVPRSRSNPDEPFHSLLPRGTFPLCERAVPNGHGQGSNHEPPTPSSNQWESCCAPYETNDPQTAPPHPHSALLSAIRGQFRRNLIDTRTSYQMIELEP